MGGAVSCSKKIYERLVVLPEYTAATGMSSALMYAFIYAQELYKTQLKKLQQNINIFKGLVESLPINHHASLPVFILPAITSYEALLEKNVIISSFAYPDVNGEKINRVVLNALHTDEDLEGLSTALKKVLL